MKQAKDIRQAGSFKPPFLLGNCHLQTIYPALFSRVETPFHRERIELEDGDFIDVDWHRKAQDKLLFLLHGFEGDSDSYYVKRMVNHFVPQGYDAVVMNYRGCSGKPNRMLKAYHSGKTDDVHEVLQNLFKAYPDYGDVVMLGFSMGGNHLLKYFGEQGDSLDARIRAGIAISTPCELKDCAEKLDLPSGWIYRQRFFGRLQQKFKAKHAQFQESEFSFERMMQLRTFRELDDYFTGPVHDFEDAIDYWRQNSSLYYLDDIRRPCLLINAQDDPFLTESCHPFAEAERNPHFEFIATPGGGHVGFWDWSGFHLQQWAWSWVEQIESQLNQLKTNQN